MRGFHIVLAALLCLAGMPAQNRVWIVDKQGGPGVWKDTLGLMPSVRDGDLILLRHGEYAAIATGDKSVTIAHDTRTGPVSIRGLHVVGLAAAKDVTVQGVQVLGTVRVENCAGSVALDRCEVQSVIGVTVVGSRAVTLTGCSIDGTFSGLSLTRAAVEFHNSRCIPRASLGGHAVTVDSQSNLVASESQLVGADGMRGLVISGFCYTPARPGGDGLRLERGGRAELTNCRLAGGAAVAPNPPCLGAGPGSAIRNAGGTLLQITRPTRALQANSPVREGERLKIEIGGHAGDEAFLLYNLAHGVEPVPGCGAALFPVSGNIGILYVGRVGATPLKLEVIVQPMAAVTAFTPVHAQVLLLPPAGCVLTPPTTILLLDQGY